MRFNEDYKTTSDLTKLIEGILEKPSYLSRSDYSTTIQNLQHVFPPENIHFEFYETLFCTAGIKRICSFLSVGFHPAKFRAMYNVSTKAQLGVEHRQILVNLLRDQYAFAFEEFGDRVPENWKADGRLPA
jgi:hypothetical protein